MADITVTPSVVAAGSGASLGNGIAGETITAGTVLFLDATAAGKLKGADSDVLESAKAVGISLNGADFGQPIAYQSAGNINPGGTVTVGEIYHVSSTAGGIAPDADVGSGEYRTILGVGTASNNILLAINITGIQIP